MMTPRLLRRECGYTMKHHARAAVISCKIRVRDWRERRGDKRAEAGVNQKRTVAAAAPNSLLGVVLGALLVTRRRSLGTRSIPRSSLLLTTLSSPYHSQSNHASKSQQRAARFYSNSHALPIPLHNRIRCCQCPPFYYCVPLGLTSSLSPRLIL